MARVMSGLDMTINMLRESGARDAQLAHLKNQHAGLNVDADYFEVSLLQCSPLKNHLIEIF
jgi:hypothetical protein